MKIIIETIPHADQRYNTCGDWYWERSPSTNYEEVLNIKVSGGIGMRSSGTAVLLIGVHELIEALLCNRSGIDQETVDKFDKSWRPQWDGITEPGDDPACPYREEHFFATTIERLIAQRIGVDWHKYEQDIESLG